MKKKAKIDDWNIYECHCHRHDDCYLVDGGGGGSPVMMHPEWYKGEHLWKLYEKLLEDIKRVGCITQDCSFKNVNPNIIIRIIKRRFGVE